MVALVFTPKKRSKNVKRRLKLVDRIFSPGDLVLAKRDKKAKKCRLMEREREREKIDGRREREKKILVAADCLQFPGANPKTIEFTTPTPERFQ
jgi:hypothetical protein